MSDGLTYKDSGLLPKGKQTKVFLASKRIGTIFRIKDGYHYRPLKSKLGGDTFSTLDQCKRSLEHE